MDAPSELILITDPYFWSKTRVVDDRVAHEIVQVRGDSDLLPFDVPALLYYLIFSPLVRAVSLRGGGVEVTIEDERVVVSLPERVYRTKAYATRAYERGMSKGRDERDADTFNHMEIEDIDEIVRAEEESRPHDVLRLLSRIIDTEGQLRRRLYQACLFPSLLYQYDAVDTNKILGTVDSKSLELRYSKGIPESTARADLKMYARSVDVDALDKLLSQLPAYVFLSVGSLKFICWGFSLDDEKISGSLTTELVVSIKSTCKAISLSYWEVYVEPWLHLPHLLLNRPNPKLTGKALDYWSDIAGFDIRLETLERVIIASILVDRWDDDVWIGAHQLLSLK